MIYFQCLEPETELHPQLRDKVSMYLMLLLSYDHTEKIEETTECIQPFFSSFEEGGSVHNGHSDVHDTNFD